MADGSTHMRPRSSRWRRVRLFTLLGLLVMLVVFVVLDRVSESRLDAALARVEQRVGPVSVEQLSSPDVPEAENRARLVRAAIALSVAPSREATSAMTSLFGATEARPIPDAVRGFVAANQRILDVAAEFGTRQKSDWEVNYITSENMPSLLDIRTLGDLLALSALIDLEAGRLDAAASHLANGLAVSSSLREEPHLISQLIRIAVADRQIDGVQHLITQPGLSRSSLDLMAARLAENRSPQPMTVAMAGEVKLINSQFAAIETGRADHHIDGPRQFWSVKPLAWIGRPLLRFQRSAYLERMDLILASQAGPRPRKPLPPEHSAFFLRQLMPGITAGLERALASGDDHDSQIAAAESVVALRRYQMDRGDYPAGLDALVPQYLPAVPIDPFTGQPPVYVRDGTGFTLTTQRYDPRRATQRPTSEWRVKLLASMQRDPR